MGRKFLVLHSASSPGFRGEVSNGPSAKRDTVLLPALNRPVIDHDHEVINFNEAIVIEIARRQGWGGGAFG